MSGDDDLLLRRLIGAAVIFVGVFLLAWLLPQPEEGASEREGTVVLRMHAPESELPSERLPRASGMAEASESSGGRATSAEKETTVERAPSAEQGPTAAVEPAPEPAPEPDRVREPEPTPEPEQSAPEATAGGGDWWIQAAAYSDQAAARRGRDRIAAGFSVGSRLREVRIDGRRFWRLQVGPLPQEAAAEALAEGLRDEGFQGARVFRETGS